MRSAPELSRSREVIGLPKSHSPLRAPESRAARGRLPRPTRAAACIAVACASLVLWDRDAAAAPGLDAGGFDLFPPSRGYPTYTADPRRPEFSVAILGYPDPEIADSGNRRFGLTLGGRFGLLRLEPRARPERGWQLDIEAGFTGQFDIEHSLDNVGWDGLYSLLVSTKLAEKVSFQIGAKHVSSHVGDEFAERTGRKRIGYTREELAVGLASVIHERWRSYAEAGWDFSPKEEIGQAPIRLQAGLVYEAEGTLARGQSGWYAAADLGAMEERDWHLDLSLQVGFRFPSGGRLWRTGIAIRDGSVPIGEFFQTDETYIALGLWLEP